MSKGLSMSNATKLILVFGIYVVLVGLTLTFIPNTLIGLMGFPVANEPWIRALGILASVLGLYYVQAARENNIGFYRMTIWGRILFMLSLSTLGLVTPGYAGMILFGAVDLIFAAATWFTMRQEASLGVAVS
jgi:hypothetical protein